MYCVSQLPSSCGGIELYGKMRRRFVDCRYTFFKAFANYSHRAKSGRWRPGCRQKGAYGRVCIVSQGAREKIYTARVPHGCTKRVRRDSALTNAPLLKLLKIFDGTRSELLLRRPEKRRCALLIFFYCYDISEMEPTSATWHVAGRQHHRVMFCSTCEDVMLSRRSLSFLVLEAIELQRKLEKSHRKTENLGGNSHRSNIVRPQLEQAFCCLSGERGRRFRKTFAEIAK